MNTNKLNLSNCADEIKTFIDKNEIKLVLSNSSYVGRDIIAFLSIDFNTSPVSNVTNFEIDDRDAFLAITNAILNKQLNLLKKNNSDVILINTTNIFSEIEKEKATLDGLHLTPYGNSTIAKEIAKKILLNL